MLLSCYYGLSNRVLVVCISSSQRGSKSWLQTVVEKRRRCVNVWKYVGSFGLGVVSLKCTEERVSSFGFGVNRCVSRLCGGVGNVVCVTFWSRSSYKACAWEFWS